MNERNFKIICRLCLNKSYFYSNIYSCQSSQSNPIYEDINFVYDLQISVEDGLPEYVCQKCSTLVKEFKLYKTNAHRAKLQLVHFKQKLNYERDYPASNFQNAETSASHGNIVENQIFIKQEEVSVDEMSEDEMHSREDLDDVAHNQNADASVEMSEAVPNEQQSCRVNEVYIKNEYYESNYPVDIAPAVQVRNVIEPQIEVHVNPQYPSLAPQGLHPVGISAAVAGTVEQRKLQTIETEEQRSRRLNRERQQRYRDRLCLGRTESEEQRRRRKNSERLKRRREHLYQREGETDEERRRRLNRERQQRYRERHIQEEAERQRRNEHRTKAPKIEEGPSVSGTKKVEIRPDAEEEESAEDTELCDGNGLIASQKTDPLSESPPES